MPSTYMSTHVRGIKLLKTSVVLCAWGIKATARRGLAGGEICYYMQCNKSILQFHDRVCILCSISL